MIKSVYARFKDNIWVSDLPETGSLSSKTRGAKIIMKVMQVSQLLLRGLQEL